MADSGYIFESGQAIAVGDHGDHDYVYASGDPVTDAGESDVVFESGTGIGGGPIIDDFERGNLAPYSNDGWTITGSTVYEGNYAAAATPDFGGDNTKMVSYPGGGLNTYPTRGDKWEQYAYPRPTGDTSNTYGFVILAEPGGPNYALWLQVGASRFELQGGRNNIDVGTSAQIPTDEWCRVVVDTDTSGTIDCELYDAGDSLVASFSVVDDGADGGGWGALNHVDSQTTFTVDYAKKLVQ